MLKSIVVALIMAGPVMAQDLILPPDPTRLPPHQVTVFKELEDAGRLPFSVDAIEEALLHNLGANTVSDAAVYAPNTFFSEFTARKLSNPRFRGIGASPLNPGVTTYIDGVPQFNANSSSIELLDVEQVEFARGPLSPLFGRNALGGVINITTRRPTLSQWKSAFSTATGNYAEWREQISVSGPIADGTAVSLTLGGSGRQGFTTNDITGRDLDHRAAGYFKGQLWWTPNSRWESRLIISNEIDRDGDYALNDLGALMVNPYHAARDYEGDTRRNVFSTTILARYEDALYTFSTITGFVHWSTRDRTDLDYTPGSFVTRQNDERDFQFTEELRFAINTPAPITPNISLKWQAGLFLFSQRYSQEAANTYEAFVLDPMIPFPVTSTSPQGELNDTGFGLYGQTTLNVMKRVDVVIGLRADREDKDAELNSFYGPAIAPAATTTGERNFRNWSPEFAGAYHFDDNRMVYASFGRGYKAGGFNAVAPAGSESYNAESAYHVELGAKGSMADGKLAVSAAAFFIDWNRMQLNLPDPFVPAQFYIGNVDGARSKGVELEVHARPHPDVDLFGGLGFTNARFDDGTSLSGMDISHNPVPNAPQHTFTLGTELKRELPAGLTVYGHVDAWFNGGFKYDESNTAGQPAYSLVNFRAGARGSRLFVEFFMKNVGGTRYIPIAFAFPMLAPSGFLGEMGAPRRFGVAAQLQID
ncbi:MAG TPA: TonB-dependent receptor [Terriglobia bacterium]|nr:TonB-dependent receptor [Terriglobia bacterium]